MTDYSLWEENRGRENSRRTVTVETPTENALVAQDGIGGYNWSYQAEEVHPTNYALIAIYIFRNSSSSDSRVEPKTVRKNSFRPLVIEDWNSDDDSEVEFIPNVKDKTVRPSTEKIKFIKSAREIVEKATIDESNLWHRRLGHINFKNMNKLVRGNLVRGLPSKIFENDHSCVACQKGKQHKASFLEMKGIKREFSVARTPQQNGVAERRNRTQIEVYKNRCKFDGKADEGFFVGYSVVSKAMRVFNKRTRIVEETLNIRFLENAPNVTGNGPGWLFDELEINIVAVQAKKKTEPEQEYNP
ncbi:ribonuclease H-like domain-containing protein [Tanacetum coccineum]|uniref:Ribonuclease H-like domain-containing protein n=1 Tax=Tanacetum coccineum TaxID=301880 RepID=A0ABQ4XAS4_9ASTR